MCSARGKQEHHDAKHNNDIGQVKGGSAKENQVINRKFQKNSIQQISERAKDDEQTRRAYFRRRFPVPQRDFCKQEKNNEGQHDHKRQPKGNVKGHAEIFMDGKGEDARLYKFGFVRERGKGDAFGDLVANNDRERDQWKQDRLDALARYHTSCVSVFLH